MNKERLDVWVLGFTASRATNVARLVKVFGIENHQAAKLVDAAPVVVKRSLDPTAAVRWRRALERSGVQVAVVPRGQEPSLSGRPAPLARPGPAADPEGRFRIELTLAPEPGDDEGRMSAVLPSQPPPVPAPREPVLARIGRGLWWLTVRLAAMAVVAFGGWVAYQAHASVPVLPVFASIDEELAWDLTQPHVEARQWATDRALIGLADRAAAADLVDALYEAGAREVNVTRLAGSGRRRSSSTLLIELPAEGHDAVLAVARRAVHAGGAGRVEVGERYLRLAFAAPVLQRGGIDPWAQPVTAAGRQPGRPAAD